jgi:TRAP transporter TAXI family solute receptor
VTFPRIATAVLALFLAVPTAFAQTRVTIKSATSSSSYYVMIVQIGETLREATGGQVIATIEESQGSVQNVKEAARRPGNFMFTTPPNLLDSARKGEKPFEGETGHDQARTLFVMPGVTVHFVVRADSGVSNIADLAGKKFVPGGKGSFCDGRTRTILRELGLEGKVDLVDIELSGASNAVRNRQVVGYSTCSSHPTPDIQELAATTPLRLLSMSSQQIRTMTERDPLSSPVTIAKGTYKGIDEDIQTVGLPVGMFTTTRMDEQTAYQVTRSFWAKRDEMARKNPLWAGVRPEQIAAFAGTKLHPGALRYYREVGVSVPASMQ